MRLNLFKRGNIFKTGIFKPKLFSDNNYTLKYRLHSNKKMYVSSLNKISSEKSVLGFRNYLLKLIDFAKEKKVKQIYFRTHVFYNHSNLQKSLNVKIINPEGADVFFKKLKDKDIKTLDLYGVNNFIKGQKYYVAGLNSKERLVTIEIKENELPIYVLKI